MAETPVAENNKPVTFGTKRAREPAGIKAKKPKIRKAAKRAISRGMISEKAAKRHFGGI